MSFDVPKVVQSPGCDHGHDEESRNGRDMKIDILEAYIWISEVFRVKSGFYRSTGGFTELSLKARLDRSSRDVIELNVC